MYVAIGLRTPDSPCHLLLGTGARMLCKSGSLTSDAASLASAYSLQPDQQRRGRQPKSLHSSQGNAKSQQQHPLSPGQQQSSSLASVPELAVLSGAATGASLGAAGEPKKVTKKMRKKKTKRRSRLSQLCGMSDQEKSSWMLEHCKVKMLCGKIGFCSCKPCHILCATGRLT